MLATHASSSPRTRSDALSFSRAHARTCTRTHREFLDRLNRRRGDVQVSLSIDIAGRRIYGTEDDTPLFPEGDAAAAAAAAGAGAARGDAGDAAAAAGEGGGVDAQGGGSSEHGQGGNGRKKSRGPTVDLMGPTGQRDMNLGARHGVLKEQVCIGEVKVAGG